ncbi:SDR family NAD(P)-dependent oxidoreductase [Paraburkholderia dilworthii]|uniref:SDR family NAD(P)-dependent oxidoreductase n=1 Tax=Paraburkholderia dilworthii TaxID=948106 RepID=UPI002ADDB948|nr:SDR family NAD(P)-dependent oxidoreductase [Paraburkholderia dilworthii]
MTGAGAGIGHATAEQFVRNGYDVVLISHGRERLNRAASKLSSTHGIRALPIPIDVADAQAFDAAAPRVERALRPIDVRVNVAMATVFAPPMFINRHRTAPFGVPGASAVAIAMAAVARRRGRLR